MVNQTGFCFMLKSAQQRDLKYFILILISLVCGCMVCRVHSTLSGSQLKPHVQFQLQLLLPVILQKEHLISSYQTLSSASTMTLPVLLVCFIDYHLNVNSFVFLNLTEYIWIVANAITTVYNNISLNSPIPPKYFILNSESYGHGTENNTEHEWLLRITAH